jgi:DNA-binding response OmpR family regulator
MGIFAGLVRREFHRDIADLEGNELTTDWHPPKHPKVTTLLLVEDYPAVRLSLKMGLQSRRKFKILEAASADEALEICRSYQGGIDLFVVDVVMPGIWGDELARRLALMRPRTPVVFISGHTAEMLVDHGILTGTEPFLGKPFDGKVLAQKIEELLGTANPATRPNEGALPASNS